MTRPDFSGEYVLNRAASTLSSHAAGVEGAAMRIEHRDPVFRCSAKFIAEGKALAEFSFELSTDGPEVAPGENGSRLYWDGDALVVEHRVGAPDSVMTISWRHEVIDNGQRLRAFEQLRGGGRDQDNVWEFERQ
jgi:hypothetical protein